MILDIGSFMFNMNPQSGGTPSWGTDMGQGEGYKFNFEDFQNLITSLTYTCVDDMANVSLEFGKGGSRTSDYNIILAGLYKKVYVNNQHIDNAEFMLLIAKQINNPNGFHIGRKTLKYSPNIVYQDRKPNENCINLIKSKFGLNDNSAWFINELYVENQDELHMKMYIADSEKPMEFTDANERKEFVKNMIGEDATFSESKSSGSYILKEESAEYTKNNKLKEFYLNNLINNNYVEEEIKKRHEFVEQYPIEKLLSLTKEEYYSFCYDLEMGTYKTTGFGIRGVPKQKFGFYYKNDDRLYRDKNKKVIDNPDEYWYKFRQQLHDCIVDLGVNEPKFELTEKYDLLGGSGGFMFLTKLLSLYYPDRFISSSKNELFEKLNKYLGVKHYNNAISNSYYSNIAFRNEIPEANNNDGFYISNAIWKFFNINEESEDEDGERITGGFNKIYYGVPGCGKSFSVDQIDFKNDDYLKIRTTFHPEYSNSDFVGQLIPKLKRDDQKQENHIVYEFQKGAFTKALIEAMNTPSKKVCLIIEEINRGNASAIFGDIFQLLDRDEDGESVFGINNPIMEDFLIEELNSIGLEKYNSDGNIKLPSNLWIIATMNTSDQNVYTLDTAFKRRWKMHRVSNEFEENDRIANMFIPGTDVTWKNFIEVINTKIKNTKSLGVNSEDKQLGTHFVSEEELSEKPFDFDNSTKIEAFAEKVLLYIWDDIAKIKPDDWFKERTYDDLLKSFYDLRNEKLSIFRLDENLTFNHEGNENE